MFPKMLVIPSIITFDFLKIRDSMHSEYENGPNSIKTEEKTKRQYKEGVCDITINYPILKANKN